MIVGFVRDDTASGLTWNKNQISIGGREIKNKSRINVHVLDYCERAKLAGVRLNIFQNKREYSVHPAYLPPPYKSSTGYDYRYIIYYYPHRNNK